VSLPSGKRVSTRWVLSFFREVPLELAALDELMAFENPMVTESSEATMQSADGSSRLDHASSNHDNNPAMPPLNCAQGRP
jgi:hypothetical protein